jgi:hypothetical protein
MPRAGPRGIAEFRRVPVAAIVRHQRGGQLIDVHFGRPQTVVRHAAMGQCRGAGHALVPAEQLSLAVEHCADLVHAAGAVVVVVRDPARASTADAPAFAGLGQHHRFGDIVVVEPATVAAADARHADLDLRWAEAGEALHHRPGFLRRLVGTTTLACPCPVAPGSSSARRSRAPATAGSRSPAVGAPLSCWPHLSRHRCARDCAGIGWCRRAGRRPPAPAPRCSHRCWHPASTRA